MFNYTFKITDKIIFEVNNNNYFATSAAEFNQNYTDFDECGQCQHILPYDGPAKYFYEKWDCLHLSKLNTEQEQEIMRDIDNLKDAYEWIPYCSFSEQQKLIRNK